jgi:hypothetical protein
MSSCEQEQNQANNYSRRDSLKQTSLTMPPPEKIELKLAAKAFAILSLGVPPKEDRGIHFFGTGNLALFDRGLDDDKAYAQGTQVATHSTSAASAATTVICRMRISQPLPICSGTSSASFRRQL